MKTLAFIAVVLVNAKAISGNNLDLWDFFFVDPSSPLAAAPVTEDAAVEHEAPHKKQRQGAAPDDGDEKPGVEASSGPIVFLSASEEIQEAIKTKAREIYASGAYKNWTDLARKAVEGTNVCLLGRRVRAWVDPGYVKTLSKIDKKSEDKYCLGKIKLSEADKVTQDDIKTKAREVYASGAYKNWTDLGRKAVEGTSVQPPRCQHVRFWVDEKYHKDHRARQTINQARYASRKKKF